MQSNDTQALLTPIDRTMLSPYLFPSDGCKGGMILVREGEGGYGFLDKNGALVVPCIYKDAWSFSGGFAQVRDETDHVGFVDTTGKIVIPLIYEGAYNFSHGYALVKQNGRFGAIDCENNLVIPCIYEKLYGCSSEGLFLFCENGKYGAINTKNEVVIPPRFAETNGSFRHGHLAVRERKWGVINASGEIEVPFEYMEIECLADGCVVQQGRKSWGALDYQGNQLLAPTNNEIYTISTNIFNDGRCPVKRQGRWGFVDRADQEVIPCRYSDIAEFSNGLAAVGKNGCWGFVDPQGEEVLPCIYQDVWEFYTNGLVGVKQINEGNNYRRQSRYGCVDLHGEVRIPFRYRSMSCEGSRYYGICTVPDTICYALDIYDLSDSK